MLEHEQKNVWKMIGMRIRRERIKRNWSQSGLCYGICAVSYLSKIEQGKMEVSEEILKLLWKHSMNFYLRILYKNF